MEPLIWQGKKMHHNSWCPDCKGEKIITELLGALGQRQFPVDSSIKSNIILLSQELGGL